MKQTDLVRIFVREKKQFARTYPRCSSAIVLVKEFPRHKDRDCAQCYTDTLEVHFHPDVLGWLTHAQCVALVRHELAHCARPDLGEAATDSLAELVSGEPIYYGADDIQTLDVGVRPRPGYLPR